MKAGWVILGVAAAGGVGYYLYNRSKTTAAPSVISPTSTSLTPPIATSSAALPTSSTPPGSYALPAVTVPQAQTLLAQSSNSVEVLVQKAISLAQLGHPKEGSTWAMAAFLVGASQSQIDRLQSVGYAI